MFILTINISYSQTIKDLSQFHNDSQRDNYNIGVICYYKDIANNFAPFIGQWKYVDGNRTFIMQLWKETQYPISEHTNGDIMYYSDLIFGHYIMYQDYGLPTQQQVYTSQTSIYAGGSQIWNTVVVADSIDSTILSGIIKDIYATPLNANYPWGISAYFYMKINVGTSPPTANVSIGVDELLDPNQPKNFTIPTEFILTKM